jgi:CDP-glucose 4,6-dehydratase
VGKWRGSVESVGAKVNPRFWKGKKVFLTGHTGFKGSWLSLWLALHGAKVRGYALKPPTQPSLFDEAKLGARVESIIGDIGDLDHLRRAAEDFQPDIILHMAAQSLVRLSYDQPVETYRTNVLGTVHILEVARSVKSARVLINVTTDKVYENRERSRAYREADRLGGWDPYSNSKACSELVTDSYRKSFLGNVRRNKNYLSVATARSGNVIGGGDWARDRLIPDLVRAFSAKIEAVIRYPQAVRPWQHVLEPLHGYLLLAEAMWPGKKKFDGAWNFGPPSQLSKPVSWVADRMVKIWPGQPQWKTAGGKHVHEAQNLTLNSRKAISQLGWHSLLSIQQTIDWICEWHVARLEGRPVAKITEQQIRQYEVLLKARRS